jgi:hypothetical protein
MTPGSHAEPTAVHAVPVAATSHGLRLLVLRQFEVENVPPAFAFIDQPLLRAPGRGTRHGVFFAPAFLPEVMDWLIALLGRPSRRDPAGAPMRNPRWPSLSWGGEPRLWPDGTSTVEWFVDIAFPEDEIAAALFAQWCRTPD